MVEIRGQSFSILAEVTTKPAAQGVIFKQGGAHGGHVLFIDEHAVGALRDVEIHPGTFGLAGASLSIGRNGGLAVSSDYPAPYPFTGGTITQVVVDISGEPYENLEKKLAIVFAKD
ncbi:Arylsulfatase [Mycobacteroides abscessus subsp. abscessus]|nr:Arylsulfatase [Mycobacteroides abscessus subsp. abscessus]SHU17176.1 Arylsulfatase [Mycobacteroides abscessus subsp. abscessus]SHU85790.1 arylsulfatase [Mycobacteroides abscessus subsp. abscessus]SHV25951.1 arylsulfatase [Mycobacteroides abscessus subsp. abscessus]SHW05391.1 arylsulfatase [Mycobacteroides abscessus subsp. abscessus]